MRHFSKTLPYFIIAGAFLALAALVLFLTLHDTHDQQVLAEIPSLTTCEPESGKVPKSSNKSNKKKEPPSSAISTTTETTEEPSSTTDQVSAAEDGDDEDSTRFFSQLEKWSDGEKNRAAEKDAEDFAAQFKSLPPAIQEENLNHALNLIPDANIILLSGLLFDKTIKPEFNELIFNDILNRDESIKLPIIRQVHKDRAHPCWSDAAWILDVTDEPTEQ